MNAHKTSLIIAGAVLALGQIPDLTQKEAPASFSSRTNLVVVPVVVRDGKGRAVGNLTKDDFQLFDRGKLQAISRFSVEKTSERAATQAAQVKAAAEASGETDSASIAAGMPSHFVAYLIDDLHMDVGDLAQNKAAAGKHLDKTLTPTDRAAIVTASGDVMLDFTGDRTAMHESLNKIMPKVAAQQAVGCPMVTLYQFYAASRGDPTPMQAAIQDAIGCAQLDTKLPGSAGLAIRMAETAFDTVGGKDQHNTQRLIATLTMLIKRMSTLPGERTIVLLSSGFLVNTQGNDYYTGYSDAGLVDLAIKGKITVNTLDARGLYVVVQGGDAMTPSRSTASLRISRSYENEGASIASEGLAQLAEDTGGTFIHNTNDIEGGLKLLGGAPEYQYFLGFSPQNLRFDGAFHQIKVSIKTKGANLQARRGYFAPKRATDEAEQALQEIRESLFSRDEVSDIPITMQTQFFKATPDQAKLSVLAKLDLHDVHLRKNEGRNLDSVVFVTGLFDRNGNLIKGITKTVDLHVRDEDLPQRLAAGLSAKTSFDVPPGKYVIRLVVRESEGQAMAAKNGLIEIP